PVLDAFLDELRMSLPDRSERERVMLLGFAAGAMVQAILISLRPDFTNHFLEGGVDGEELSELLVKFCAFGMTGSSGSEGEAP
ncbi:MAG: hypothetical protein KDD44_08725, partial [Bdellovibrionales bacterium]|nr:hypothetical protein [Bdellovibrionales bacterium]